MMENRRAAERIKFVADSIIIDKETGEKFYGQVKDISPLGVAITVDESLPNLIGGIYIIIISTMIMCAESIREDAELGTKKTFAFKAIDLGAANVADVLVDQLKGNAC